MPKYSEDDPSAEWCSGKDEPDTDGEGQEFEATNITPKFFFLG